MSLRAYNVLGSPYDCPRVRVGEVGLLAAGDHVGFDRWSKWTYGIVERVDPALQVVHIICYKQGRIRQRQVPFGQETWYRLEHNPDYCRPPEQVVQKAQDLLNMTYEDFTRYCKLDVDEHHVQRFLASTQEGKLVEAAKLLKVTGVPGALGEIGLAARDIKKARDHKERGMLEEHECENAVATRATVATGQVGGAAGGALAGAAVGAVVTGPLAPVGAVVGGVIGGVAGLVAGTGVGIGAAKAVVKIRDSLHRGPVKVAHKEKEPARSDNSNENSWQLVQQDQKAVAEDSLEIGTQQEGMCTPEAANAVIEDGLTVRMDFRKKAAAERNILDEKLETKLRERQRDTKANNSPKVEDKCGVVEVKDARRVIEEGQITREDFRKKKAAEKDRMNERLQQKLMEKKKAGVTAADLQNGVDDESVDNTST